MEQHDALTRTLRERRRETGCRTRARREIDCDENRHATSSSLQASGHRITAAECRWIVAQGRSVARRGREFCAPSVLTAGFSRLEARWQRQGPGIDDAKRSSERKAT
jgi:hypothetical protein